MARMQYDFRDDPQPVGAMIKQVGAMIKGPRQIGAMIKRTAADPRSPQFDPDKPSTPMKPDGTPLSPQPMPMDEMHDAGPAPAKPASPKLKPKKGRPAGHYKK